MNYILAILLICAVVFYKKQGFTPSITTLVTKLETTDAIYEFPRTNSYDISNYASNIYPCVNANKPAKRSRT